MWFETRSDGEGMHILRPCVIKSAGRTDGGPSPVLDNQESPGKRGPLSRLAALHHQKCGRTRIASNLTALIARTWVQ